MTDIQQVHMPHQSLFETVNPLSYMKLWTVPFSLGGCATARKMVQFVFKFLGYSCNNLLAFAWNFLSFSKTLYPHCCSPPRCINDGYPVGCERYLSLDVASGQNAPQGVEKVHYECRIDNESSDRGNNTL